MLSVVSITSVRGSHVTIADLLKLFIWDTPGPFQTCSPVAHLLGDWPSCCYCYCYRIVFLPTNWFLVKLVKLLEMKFDLKELLLWIVCDKNLQERLFFFPDGWFETVSTLQKIPASFVILVSKLFITQLTERSWAILMLTLTLMVVYLGHENIWNIYFVLQIYCWKVIQFCFSWDTMSVMNNNWSHMTSSIDFRSDVFTARNEVAAR